MQISIKIILALLASCAAAKDCSGSNGECIQYYSDDNCVTLEGEYQPTCQGNCFVYGFNSIRATGGKVGVEPSCTLYSDDNCEHEVDYINTGDNRCHSYNTFSSMRCYYDC
jgi:hypothetical protein